MESKKENKAKYHLCKDGNILLKINDQLISVQPELFDPEKVIKPNWIVPRSSELESLVDDTEVLVKVFNLSDLQDKLELESLLEDLNNGWWTGLAAYDCKFDPAIQSWKVLVIVYRNFKRVELNYSEEEK